MPATAKIRRPVSRAVQKLELAPEPVLRAVPTGSTLLDLQRGIGGWPLGRMVNIVGDSSTGKTGLAIEAMANFARLYGVDNCRYAEAEAALDRAYARRIGLPSGIQLTEEGEIRTVEQFYDDLAAFLKRVEKGPAMYCLDSVDALSSEGEGERKIGEGSYRVEKPRVLSELFRRQIADVADRECLLLLISQTRDMIGSHFPMKTRSGGRSLDFYASICVWLHEEGKHKRTVAGVERIDGIYVRALNKKNKCGPAFRQISVLYAFDYGIDDEVSMIEWLKQNKTPDDLLMVPLASYTEAVRRARAKRDVDTLMQYSADLRAVTRARWTEIEAALEPPLRKYEVM